MPFLKPQPNPTPIPLPGYNPQPQPPPSLFGPNGYQAPFNPSRLGIGGTQIQFSNDPYSAMIERASALKTGLVQDNGRNNPHITNYDGLRGSGLALAKFGKGTASGFEALDKVGGKGDISMSNTAAMMTRKENQETGVRPGYFNGPNAVEAARQAEAARKAAASGGK